jgi:hypothetical protein
MRRIILSLLLLVIGATAFSQETFPINGVRDMRTGVYAFTNATIVQNEKTKIEKGTLVISKEKLLPLVQQLKFLKKQLLLTVMENLSILVLWIL